VSQLGPCVDLRANPGRVPQVGPLFSPGRAAEISARNRRVIVIDTEILKFKRMWGGYGNKPDDKDLGPYNPDAPPVQQFRLPHNVALSKAGLVYVADRVNDRIQVFKRDGTFVREAFVAAKTLLAGSASGLAFSPDPRFVYVIDGANHHVWIFAA